MTIDRTALRRLVEAEPDDERQCAKCHATMSFEPETEPSALCHRCVYEVAETLPALLDELDAKDRRIAELEKQNDRFVAIVAACDERGEVGNTVDALAECRLRLSIATELNVGDRKRIAELEAIVSSTDDLVRQLRNALCAALEIGRAGEGNDLKWRTLTKHACKLLPSEET